MTWTYYRLVFRLCSPLHVGYRRVGNLMETRPYVHGKAIWAALTARITRDHHDGSRGPAYEHIGGLVREYFRFGYLWPSLDGEKPYYPWEHDDFDYLLRGSYTSTALDYNRSAALEGQLHETEFVAPAVRDGRPVHLVGDLWVRGRVPDDLKGWPESLKQIQLGGERGYGWGRVKLVTDLEQSGQQGVNEPLLQLKNGERIPAHVLAADAGPSRAVVHVTGPVEPLVGWERDNKRDGKVWRISPRAHICWEPGSTVTNETQVTIGEYGIWQAPGTAPAG